MTNSEQEVNENVFWSDIPKSWYNKFSHSHTIGFDVETSGLEQNRDKVYSISLMDEDEDIVIVRFTDHGELGYPDLIARLLQNESIVKVAHYALFDLKMLRTSFGMVNFSNIYCTCIASRLVRTYAPSHSYKDMVKELFKVDLKKDTASTPWFLDQLTDEQIRYQENDVRYLLKSRDLLNQYAEKLERSKLVLDTMKTLPTIAELYARGWSNTLF